MNDDAVEILEMATAVGYARVKRCDGVIEGWVRVRNISKIERKAGLPDLSAIAQVR